MLKRFDTNKDAIENEMSSKRTQRLDISTSFVIEIIADICSVSSTSPPVELFVS